MLTVLYIAIIIILALWFVRGQDRCFLGYFFFIGMCALFTPILAIPFWKVYRGQ